MTGCATGWTAASGCGSGWRPDLNLGPGPLAQPTTHRVTARITTGMVTYPMAVDTATLAVTSSSATR